MLTGALFSGAQRVIVEERPELQRGIGLEEGEETASAVACPAPLSKPKDWKDAALTDVPESPTFPVTVTLLFTVVVETPKPTLPPLPPPQETAEKSRKKFSSKENIPPMRILGNRPGVCVVINSFIIIVYRKMLKVDG